LWREEGRTRQRTEEEPEWSTTGTGVGGFHRCRKILGPSGSRAGKIAGLKRWINY
jgi:hypothetical protein